MTGRSETLQQTLPNGLNVILHESHDAPVASFWVWYRVGGRHELPGLTGISHWVEHMQFKGTPSLAKGQIFAEVSRNGGYNNAMTSNDWTAYFETLPADRLDLAVRIEADRMTNSLFDPEETESERTVILSERQGAENNPVYVLYEEVVGTAFRAHPYGHMVIGHESDLRAITRDDLYDHYRRAYTPQNAFVVAAGDFDADTLLRKVDEAFAGIPAGEPLPAPRATEPPQLGERRLTLRRPAPTSYLRIAYRSPEGRHPDTVALLVADAILSGAKGMGIAGGGPMGRSARLYRALVAAGLARSAGSDFDFFVDPFLFMIGVTALPDADPARIEAVIDAELARLAGDPVADDEFSRAVKQVRAQYVYSGEGVTNQAFWLGQMELIDSFQRAGTFLDEIERVTPADVQRVAGAYLTPERRTTGWLHPSGDGGGGGTASPIAVPVRFWGIGGPRAERPAAAIQRPPFKRRELAGGIILLGQAQPDDPSVAIRIRVGAGSAVDPTGQPGLAAFAARMLLRGTASLSAEQLNERTDGLGATIAVDPSQLHADVRIRCLREDLPTMVDLAADLLRNPTFPAEEVEKVRAEIITGLREADNDTRATADRTMRELIYPEGHPLRHRVAGEPDSVTAITRDDLARFHAAAYGPGNTIVAAVGGFDQLDDVAHVLERAFAGWTSPARPLPPLATPPAIGMTARAETAIPGKSQADIVIGAPVLPRSHPDYYAFDTANLILGRLGLMGRLGANVRDKQGLAYTVMSGIEPGREASLWVGRAGVDPANVERALAGIVEEVRRLAAEPVGAGELADAKSFLTGIVPLALETNDGIAGLLLSIEHFGLGLDYLDRYPSEIGRLTADDVLRAARTHLDPDRLAIGIGRPSS